MKSKSVYHWLVVGCCSAMMAVVYGVSLNCTGVFYAPMAEALGVGRGDVAMYITMMNLLSGLASPLAARWVKKIKLWLWLAVGGVMDVFALAMWSQVTSIWQLYALALLHGIGNAMLGTVVLSMIINAWFNRRVGLATGIVYSFSGIAGAVLSPALQALMDVVGWRAAHDVAAVLAAVLVVPGVLLLRMNPQEKGLEPYGGQVREHAAAGQAAEEGRAAGKRWAVLIMVLSGFAMSFMTGLGQHLAGDAVVRGFTAAQGALLVTAVMVGNVASKLLFGVLSDAAGPRRTLIGFLMVVGAGIAGLTVAGSFGVMTVLGAMVGVTYSLGGVGLSQLARSQLPPDEANRTYAWSQMAAHVGNSVSSAGIGYIFDMTGSYTPALGLCLCLCLMALAGMTLGIGRDRRSA